VGQFPGGFLFGSAVAPYQVEGGLHATDWYQWEEACRDCSHDRADDGPNFWQHYPKDFAGASGIGLNAIRLGIEWSRIFPTRESFPDAPDAEAVAHYHAMFASAKENGLDVMATLHHFSLPVWLQDLQKLDELKGWEDAATIPLFARWAEYCGKEFGAQIDRWLTINEPYPFVFAGWFGAAFPPGKRFAIPEGYVTLENLIKGHVRAYEALHRYDTKDADDDGTSVLVSIAQHSRVFAPVDPTSAAQNLAAKRLHYQFNKLFLDAVVLGKQDKNFDFDFDDPEDVVDAKLGGHLDYIGLNYYGPMLALPAGDKNLPLPAIPLLNDFELYDLTYPKNDFGHAIDPQGLRTVLDELAQYGLPVLITENGTADAGDTHRARFLLDHLYVVAKAIDDGLDVRGYYYWSLLDNLEWASGFCPEYGLFHVDRSSPLRTRTQRGSADVYRKIIDANTVPVGLFKDHVYGEPAYCPRVGI
jgi:beta-glucosidase/6-phospho-beta-glucosidase/beta-galactosidase